MCHKTVKVFSLYTVPVILWRWKLVYIYNCLNPCLQTFETIKRAAGGKTQLCSISSNHLSFIEMENNWVWRRWRSIAWMNAPPRHGLTGPCLVNLETSSGMKIPQDFCAACSVVWSSSPWNQNFLFPAFLFFVLHVASCLETSVENMLCNSLNSSFTLISRTQTPASKQCFVSLSTFQLNSSTSIYEIGLRHGLKTQACCWVQHLTVTTFPPWLSSG